MTSKKLNNNPIERVKLEHDHEYRKYVKAHQKRLRRLRYEQSEHFLEEPLAEWDGTDED